MRRGLSLGILLSALFFSTSCSDWDNHYEGAEGGETSQKTLWENISTNPQLSEFAALVHKAGYADVLSESQAYTVWAPLNGTFNYDSLQTVADSKLTAQFVKNHIAHFRYDVSGSMDQNIFMLNDKMLSFTGNGTYQMDGVSVSQTNIKAVNGMMHTLNGMLPFKQNVYEMLDTSLLAGADSVSRYFHGYDARVLDLSKSVQGPTVNGEITYLDSVFTESNDLYSRYRAYINREDSSYTMIVPTNKAWTDALDKVASYYKYAPSFKFVNDIGSSRSRNKTTDVNINAAYLQDSLAHRCLMRSLFFNNNLYDNGKLAYLKTGEALVADSLVSTMGDITYGDDAAKLLQGAVRHEASNGALWTTDSLRVNTLTSWNPEISVECSAATYQAKVFNGTAYTYKVTSTTQNPNVPGEVSQGNYVEIIPSGSSYPEFDMYLPNVRSTTYSIYCVFVPENITSTYVTDCKPYSARITIGYNDAAGNVQEYTLGTFHNDPTRVDSVYLGDFTFPIAYVGTGSYYPYMRIASRASYNGNYDRYMRIDRIILVPKEK